MKFQIELINDRLLALAKKQINKILSQDLEQANFLKTNIASIAPGQTLWHDIIVT